MWLRAEWPLVISFSTATSSAAFSNPPLTLLLSRTPFPAPQTSFSFLPHSLSTSRNFSSSKPGMTCKSVWALYLPSVQTSFGPLGSWLGLWRAPPPLPQDPKSSHHSPVLSRSPKCRLLPGLSIQGKKYTFCAVFRLIPALIWVCRSQFWATLLNVGSCLPHRAPSSGLGILVWAPD